MKIEGVLKNIKFLMPLSFFVYCLSLFLLGNSWVFFIPLIVYISLAVVDSLYLSVKHRKNLLILPAIYLAMHFSYAFGMLSGICRNITRQKTKRALPENNKILYIKELG